MDKRLVYDPNVNLSNYNTYQEPMNNYTPISNMNMQKVPQMQQQLPPIQQMQQPLPPQIIPQQYMIPENYSIEKMTSKQKSNLKEICSISSLRKIVVIAILYVVISHNKISLLLCNYVPYVCITNALSYNILKGIIMAIIIILFFNIM